MKLYLSKCNNTLNKKDLSVEFISDHLCLNPKYKVNVNNPNAKILIDSGAFQDKQKESRVSLDEALQRQLKYEKHIGIMAERIVAYDYIDNVEETIKANQYLASKRDELAPRQIILMVQGTDTREYIHCLTETLKVAKSGDCIGFGGVALSGKVNDLKFKLLDAFKIGLPIIYNTQITDIHIFGVGTFTVLKEVMSVVKVFEQLGIDTTKLNISCDTSSFELNSTMGRVVNEELEKWEKVFSKQQKYINYHPADLAKENMKKSKRIIEKY